MQNNLFLPFTNNKTVDFNLKVKDYLENNPQVGTFSNSKITVMYGQFPQSLWSGGRSVNFDVPKFTRDEMVRFVDRLNQKGIKVRMTFTNTLLAEKHLDDEYCNLALEVLDNSFGNGIITASPLLENYIHTTHPNLGLISSITKGGDFETFKQAFEDDKYEMVVIYARVEILDYLNSHATAEERGNRVEILLSSGCGHCPIAKEHYAVESYNNLHQKEIKFHTCYKDRVGYKEIIPQPKDEIIFDPNKFQEMNLCNFKIQGRRQSLERLAMGYSNTFFNFRHRSESLKNLSQMIRSV